MNLPARQYGRFVFEGPFELNKSYFSAYLDLAKRSGSRIITRILRLAV
jgi:hypothetical protein